MEPANFKHYLPEDFRRHTFLGHNDKIRIIIFSKNNDYMYSGSWDNKIIQWNIRKSNYHIPSSPTYVFSGHSNDITFLYLSKNDRYLFSSSKDGSIKLWDVISHTELFCLTKNRGKIYALTCDTEENYLFSGDSEGSVHFWQIIRNKYNLWEKFQYKGELTTVSHAIHLLKVNPLNNQIAFSGDSSELHFLSLFKKKIFNSFQSHKKIIYSFDFHPSNPIVVSGGKEKFIIIHNYQTQQELKKISVFSSSSLLKFSPCGKYLLWVGFNNQILILNAENWDICRNYEMKNESRFTIGLSLDWALIAISSFHRNPPIIKLWKLLIP